MKDIQNKKNYISETNCCTHIWFVIGKENLKAFFSCPAYVHAPVGGLRQAQ
jgi:hypothetical protein